MIYKAAGQLVAFLLTFVIWQATPVFAAPTQEDKGTSLVLRAREEAIAGRWDDALALNEQARKLFLRLAGARGWQVAVVLADKADILWQARRLKQAEQALESTLQAVQLAKWQSPIDKVQILVQLGRQYRAMGNAGAALPIYQSTLKIASTDIVPADVALTVDLQRRVGGTLMSLDRYREAASVMDEAIKASTLLPQSVHVSALLDRAELALAERKLALAATMLAKTREQKLASLPNELHLRGEVLQSRLDVRRMEFDLALRRLKEAVAFAEGSGLARDPLTGAALTELSNIHLLRGEYTETIALQGRILSFYADALGPNHPLVATAHYYMAVALREIGNLSDSEAHFLASLRILSASMGENSAGLGMTLGEQARLQAMLGQFEESVQTAQKSVSIAEETADYPIYSKSLLLAGLGGRLFDAGRMGEAEVVLRRALSMMEADPTPSPADMIPGLNYLAEILLKAGKVDEAQEFAERAERYVARSGSLGVHALWGSRRILSEIALRQGREAEALAGMKFEIQKQVDRVARLSKISTYASEFESDTVRADVEVYLKAATALRLKPNLSLPDIVPGMFEVAQVPSSTQTSQAINGLATRFKSRDPALDALIRRRQTAGVERRAVDQQLSTTLMSDALEGDEVQKFRTNLGKSERRIAALDREISAIDAELLSRDKNFVALLEPKTAISSHVQEALEDDEVLLLQLTTSDTTYMFCVTKQALEVHETGLGAARMSDLVTQLRETLDYKFGELHPYDTAAAHELYQAVMAPCQGEIDRAKHLIVVPDQAMTSVPPGVLLRTAFLDGPKAPIQRSGELDYLARHIAISVMPSADAFTALRSIPDMTEFEQNFIGFGDPVLPRPPERNDRRGVAVDPLSGMSDWRSLDVSFSELPDTSDEINSLATISGIDRSTVFLRRQATETEVKSGKQLSAQVLTFATHGLLSGQIPELQEPALVLSLPEQPTLIDDGFLRASEIASLDLRAGLVILSACNTAGRDGRPGAPGLSGLARAFFYAGAQSMMVSHWSIPSKATVSLTTGFLEERTRHPNERSSEILRRIEVALISGSHGPLYAHPTVWGGFVLVSDR